MAWLQPCRFVIYWPSNEPSIKRCTCVNKRKNSGSRCTLKNNMTRCPAGLSQLVSRCQRESQRQTEGFGLSRTHGVATPAKIRKNCCYGQKNLGQYSSLSLSPAYLSHTTNMTLSRIKCERYIFIKKCVRSLLESSLSLINGFFIHRFNHYPTRTAPYVWLCSAYVNVQLHFGFTTDLVNIKYPFIAIAPRSILTQSGNTWWGYMYGSNRTNYVCK